MPDYFTHAITAHRIYDRLERRHKDAIKNADLYLLGAQGGDVFFTYKLTYRGNMGRALHVMDNVRLFSNLAKKSTSYAAGFAAHYALDCTLHPVIYAFERLSRAPFSHIRFEGDIGLFVSRKYGIPRRIMPPERILRCSFSVYDSIRTAVPEVTLCGIERCLKRHFAYTRAAFLSKKSYYVFGYDYSSLSGAVEDGISFGADCVSSLIEGNIDERLFGKSFLER